MAPSPLHGLNIVRTDATSDQYADNSQDPLLANAHFPDLAAQLDLWSNLTFQSDEPPAAPRKPSSVEDEQLNTPGDDDKDDDAAEAEGPAPLEAHVNAVNPTAISNLQPQPNYDMGTFLSGFGIDPFLLPQLTPPQLPPAPNPQAATLVQLLAAYPLAGAPFFPHAQASGVSPAALTPTAQAPSSSETTSQTKRASRSRKVSSPTSPSPSAEGGEQPESGSPGTQSLSAAEDKRRRNTAASARFRLKKKEREAALERRAQELEQRVSILERECEGLRRENGWLKGLVVGVTGATQGAQVAPPSNGNESTTKRKRGAEEITTTKEEKEAKRVVVSS